MDGALLAVAVFELVGRAAELGLKRGEGMVVRSAPHRDSGEVPEGSAGTLTAASGWRS